MKPKNKIPRTIELNLPKNSKRVVNKKENRKIPAKRNNPFIISFL